MAKNIQNGSARNNNNNKPLTGSGSAMERNVQMTTPQFGRTSSGSGHRSTMDDSAIKGCVHNDEGTFSRAFQRETKISVQFLSNLKGFEKPCIQNCPSGKRLSILVSIIIRISILSFITNLFR